MERDRELCLHWVRLYSLVQGFDVVTRLLCPQVGYGTDGKGTMTYRDDDEEAKGSFARKFPVSLRNHLPLTCVHSSRSHVRVSSRASSAPHPTI
jgi:hypothetical protein